MSTFKTHRLIVLLALCACDPIGTPTKDGCEVDAQAFFTNSNQLDFELDLRFDQSEWLSFTLRNDACRKVRFNYLTDVYGDDADHFNVQPPPEGYEPWIATSNAIEVTVQFAATEEGSFRDAWIQIEYSYPETEVKNAVGQMDRIYLRGTALHSSNTEDD